MLKICKTSYVLLSSFILSLTKVSTNGNIDLYSNGILNRSPEFLNLEVLFEPFGKKFYLLTVLVEFSNL